MTLNTRFVSVLCAFVAAQWGCWGARYFLDSVLHKRWSTLTNQWSWIIWAQLYSLTKLAAHQIWHETLSGGRIDTYTDRLMYYCCVLNVSLRGNIVNWSKECPKLKGICVCLFLFQLLSFLSLLVMWFHVYFCIKPWHFWWRKSALLVMMKSEFILVNVKKKKKGRRIKEKDVSTEIFVIPSLWDLCLILYKCVLFLY